ncbi:MAG: hypothetical protein IPM30_04045 [Burkholderiales bacterium]|nr:hypothetical protein [Burkholderiales bacterium]
MTIARPVAESRPPATITRVVPCQRASTPTTGCAAPQASWLSAKAKLTVAAPRAVAVLIGPMNRPIDEREPISTAISVAAASTGTMKPAWFRERSFICCPCDPCCRAAGGIPWLGTVGSGGDAAISAAARVVRQCFSQVSALPAAAVGGAYPSPSARGRPRRWPAVACR